MGILKAFVMILRAIFVYLLIPFWSSQIFIFHIEQGRKDHLDELKALAVEDGRDTNTVTAKFPFVVHLCIFLVFVVFMHSLFLFAKIKLGIIAVIISVLTLLVSFVYIIMLSKTSYQARAWFGVSIISVVTLLQGLMSTKGRPSFFVLAIIVALSAWFISLISAKFLTKNRKISAIKEENGK